ncbi:MAG TPA: radical SAM protein, partial [Candidatus Thermoplasmatota archaeon]|nr:radical SAM protein [Candidatus Thermoplasmatota archaeon]
MTAPDGKPSALKLLRDRPAGGFIQGKLPVGCVMCEQGKKMVLFVTGVCHYKCFYCPISEERRMATDAWANEKRVAADDLAAIAAEARTIGATGTGLTGGDPMYDPERTLRYIRFLKSEFGPKHHIHMYTQIPFDAKWLRPLAEAGLDEMRFHPPDETWVDPDAPEHAHYKRLWLEAKKLEDEGLWSVGFEIPCIPGSVEQMTRLVGWLARHGFK